MSVAPDKTAEPDKTASHKTEQGPDKTEQALDSLASRKTVLEAVDSYKTAAEPGPDRLAETWSVTSNPPEPARELCGRMTHFLYTHPAHIDDNLRLTCGPTRNIQTVLRQTPQVKEFA